MLQNTQQLIAQLANAKSKPEFEQNVLNELTELIKYFKTKGHDVSIIEGFIGQQILEDKDLFLYLYFRDLHFIHWGLRGNWQTFDKLDKLYYPNLQRVIEGIYNIL